MTQIFKHTNLKLDELTYNKPEKQGNAYYCNIFMEIINLCIFKRQY